MTGNAWVMAPLACLGVGAFGVYLVAHWTRARNATLAALTALCFAATLGTQIYLGYTLAQQGASLGQFPVWGRLEGVGAFLQADPGAIFIASLASALGFLVAIFSGRYISLDRRYETYYPLLLLLVTGLVGLVMAADLFNLYLFCELMGIASYVLVAFRRRTDTAIEAGFKYLIMGSVGTVTLLLGISFIYRASGSLSLTSRPLAGLEAWHRLGLACLLVGLSVKSALVPMHTWLPDAHGRAPSSVSAMLSGIVIQSTLYVLLKVTLSLGFPPRGLGGILVGMALLGMTTGNILALMQTNGKRLLAYSSIANMGYVLLSIGLGLRHGVPEGIQAGLFLLLVHTAMKGLAFLCKGACHFYCNSTTIAELAGTFERLPLVAVAFAVALASLAGLPPLVGFAAKWFLLQASLLATDALSVIALAIFLLNTLLALGYYLPMLATLFRPSGDEKMLPVSRWMSAPIVALVVVVIAMGFHPTPWLQWVGHTAGYLLAAGGMAP